MSHRASTRPPREAVGRREPRKNSPKPCLRKNCERIAQTAPISVPTGAELCAELRIPAQIYSPGPPERGEESSCGNDMYFGQQAPRSSQGRDSGAAVVPSRRPQRAAPRPQPERRHHRHRQAEPPPRPPVRLRPEQLARQPNRRQPQAALARSALCPRPAGPRARQQAARLQQPAARQQPAAPLGQAVPRIRPRALDRCQPQAEALLPLQLVAAAARTWAVQSASAT